MMSLSEKMQKIIQYFQTELSGIQVGRASKGLVENIKVDAGYGIMPIGQLGNITLPDSQTIKIEVWDKSILPAMEKAIYDADTGLTPQNFGQHVLIKVPALTTERREKLKKQVSKMAEDTRGNLRKARQDKMKSIKRLFENKELSEDQRNQEEKQVDKITKEFNEKIEAIVHTKHEEISS